MKFFFPDYFTRVERGAFILMLLFSLISLFVLFKIKHNVEYRSQEKIAFLEGVTNGVTRKMSGTLSFNESHQGEVLFHGDEIFSGENAKTKIVFVKSKNIISIPAGSLIKVEENRLHDEIEVKSGIAEFVIQKGHELVLISKGQKMVLESSNINGAGKAYLSDGKLTIQSSSGSLTLNSNGKSIVLEKDNSVSLDEGKIEIEKLKMLTPEIGEKIILENGINISWPNLAKVTISISEKSDFSSIIDKTSNKNSPYLWFPKIFPGNYFLRIEGEDHQRSTIPIEVHSKYEIKNLVPSDGQVIKLKKGDDLLLTWDEVPVKKYLVKLKDSHGVISELLTKEPRLILKKIKGASLTWSVAPSMGDSNKQQWSNSNEIGIAYEGENHLKTPSGQKIFNLNDEIHFSWEANSDERFDFFIKNGDTSSDAAVIEAESKKQTNHLNFVPRKRGFYFFELSSNDYPSLEKLVFPFEVKSSVGTWEDQADLSITESIDEDEIIEMGFTKTQGITFKDLELQVSYDDSFRRIEETQKIRSEIVGYRARKFRKYCFKISPLLNDPFLLESEIRCVDFKQLAAPKWLPKSVNRTLLELRNKGENAFLLQCPLIPKVKKYSFQVFADKEARNLIFSGDSEINSLIWLSDLYGIFYFRYSASYTETPSLNYSPLSEIIFPISPLDEIKGDL